MIKSFTLHGGFSKNMPVTNMKLFLKKTKVSPKSKNMLKLLLLALLLLFNNSFGYTTQPTIKTKIGNFSFTVTDFDISVRTPTPILK
jgi:hypothetical protein